MRSSEIEPAVRAGPLKGAASTKEQEVVGAVLKRPLELPIVSSHERLGVTAGDISDEDGDALDGDTLGPQDNSL